MISAGVRFVEYGTAGSRDQNERNSVKVGTGMWIYEVNLSVIVYDRREWLQKAQFKQIVYAPFVIVSRSFIDLVPFV